jgi:hypothetical protein
MVVLSLRLRDIGFGGLVPLASLVFRFGHSRLLRPLRSPEVRFPDREYEFFLYRIQSAPQSKTLRKSVMSRLALKVEKSLQFGLSFLILHDARSIRTGTSFSGAIDGGQRLSPKVVAQCTLSCRSVSTTGDLCNFCRSQPRANNSVCNWDQAFRRKLFILYVGIPKLEIRVTCHSLTKLNF